MAKEHRHPTHRVVIYRHDYGYRVSPGVLLLVQGQDAVVRFVNASALPMKVSQQYQRGGGSFTLGPFGGGKEYKDVRVPTSRAGSIPYNVQVKGAGIEAEGGSGPRIIITP